MATAQAAADVIIRRFDNEVAAAAHRAKRDLRQLEYWQAYCQCQSPTCPNPHLPMMSIDDIIRRLRLSTV